LRAGPSQAVAAITGDFVCFKLFTGLFRLPGAIWEKILRKTGRDGCIPESFIGNYAVVYEPGAHFPAMTRRSLRQLFLLGEAFAKVQR
jgi:hypothetical protein